jgi:hypothetical protein
LCKQPQLQQKPKNRLNLKIGSRNSLKEVDVLSNQTQLLTKNKQKPHTAHPQKPNYDKKGHGVLVVTRLLFLWHSANRATRAFR